MSGFMSVSVTHLKSAQKTLNGAKAAAEKHYEVALNQAASLARKRIRAAMPSARGLPSNSRYASGSPRKAGDMKRAVSISNLGFGFGGKRKIIANGTARILIPGAKAHEILPKNVRALSVPAGFAQKRSTRDAGVIALASVHHNAIPGHPWVEIGEAAARPEIDALIARTGVRIVAELARDIEHGGL